MKRLKLRKMYVCSGNLKVLVLASTCWEAISKALVVMNENICKENREVPYAMTLDAFFYIDEKGFRDGDDPKAKPAKWWIPLEDYLVVVKDGKC